MEKLIGGATIWARQTMDSDIFCQKPPEWFKIWFYIVSKATHEDTKNLKRGQCFLMYEWIQEATHSTREQVHHCIQYLKSATQIATQKKTRGFIVTVVNYDKYQNLSNYFYPKSHTKSHTKATQKTHRSHTINKNDNNDKNDNNTNTNTNIQQTKTTNGVQQILKIFYNTINPTINFGNTTYRRAVQELIDQFGLERTIEFTNYACSVQGERYAPTITNPYELKNKLSSLMIFAKKNKTNASKNITI